MIVSHKHKFIFLKTGKTAGTSVEIALSSLLGPDDMATPIKPLDERMRTLAPQNYLRSGGLLGWKWAALKVPGLAKRGLVQPDRETDFWNHTPARVARERLGEEIWSSYFKFAFDRNPWDKQVSYYYWATREEKQRADFRTFTLENKRRTRGWGIYTIDDQVVVDFLGRYETLAEDLAKALARVGIDQPPALPHSKGNTREERDYRKLYDEETRAFIAKRCAKEIALLGYEF
jgi:hypothetical protein